MESKRIEDNVRTFSRPSDLKITDVRAAALQLTPTGWMCPLIRIDTNQDIYGIGEVRDGASKNYALMLKRLLIGENPCNVDKLFRKIKQFGGHARQGGGVSAVEMALMDLAGKAYGVPCYMLAGGKFRDRVRMYCDTPNEPTGEAMGRKLQERIAKGFTFLKMDVGIELLAGIPGALCAPAGMLETRTVMHPFTHIRLTDKGIRILVEYVAQVRSAIGDEIPLAVDHFGHIGVEDCLRLGEALEPFNLAWLEDMVPWQLTEQWRLLRTRLKTPVCTGEDIYLHENFKPLFEAHAISVCHPDLATAGGILETKKIGDLAQEYGISMAIHMAGSPVSTIAAVHSAAATENFIALEHHFTDLPYWDDFITGIPKPIIQNGYIPVPEGPGLGIELNEDAIRAHLTPGDPAGYFEPSSYWDTDRSWDRLWS
ncbi:MAG: mandelate racemase/muconate lactonizing enzyme family protein [Thermoflexales bacterium]|nr:mandelate racemase/muconate lactonizing enzyme family protein [Thermoflexales bacterium]MDW8352211.1 mandelate racemase/muconate lactonizing enzyme family protein [Anaerolineae bacterium]